LYLHPTLRALRADDTPQRAAQTQLFQTMADWRSGQHGCCLLEELAVFSRGGAVDDFPLLAACFTPDDPSAAQLVQGLVQGLCGALDQAPLGHVPLRHFTDGAISTLLIARCGGAALSLVALDAARHAQKAAPISASYPDSECWEHVLAGSATGELVEAVPSGAQEARIERRPLRLEPGLVVHRDAQRTGVVLHRVSQTLVTLRLQRRAQRPAPSREYALTDGRLLGQAAGSARDSRLELAAALLGRIGRADAAPFLAAMAQEDESTSLRWQALRECLGLDSGAGFAVLAEVARSSGDPLATPAQTLHAQLSAQYPELAEFDLCRE
jgi:hypothetical protein